MTDRSIKVWVRSNQETPYRVAYRPKEGGPERSVSHGAIAQSRDFTAVVSIEGLAPDTEYEYRVVLGLAGEEVFAGSFRTLPQLGLPSAFSFVVGADFSRYWHPFEAFGPIAEADPAFMISAGDNTYADDAVAAQSSFETLYRVTYADPLMTAALSRVPIFMQWDDHEISNNWSRGMTGRYGPARAAAEEYVYAQAPAPVREGELYYRFRVGEAELFMLDNRSYRSRNNATDGPDKTMLGLVQRADLLQWLEASTAKLKIIVSAVPFHDHSTGSDDSWNGRTADDEPAPNGAFRTERDFLFGEIERLGVEGVVLVSGDQHFSGIYHLVSSPAALWEFMPSPIATSNRSMFDRASSSEVIFQDDTERVFGHFSVDTTVSPAVLRVRYVSSTGALMCEVTIDAEGNGLDTECP